MRLHRFLPPGARQRARQFDADVERFFDRLRGKTAFDVVFYGASAVGDQGVIWVMLAALQSWLRDDWSQLTRLIIVIGIESIIVNLGIKALFKRVRPVSTAPRPYPLRLPSTTSFPSGHATAALTGAILLSEGSRFWPIFFVLAGIVALSRTHVRVHHASDVIGGAVIGTLLGCAIRVFFPLSAWPL